MSYSVSLEKDGKSVEVPCHEEGGVFVWGGITKADLNITYNYSGHWVDTLPTTPEKGLRWLDGMQAIDAIPYLEKAVKKLGTKKDKNYWKPTPGNAGYALNILLTWALVSPGAIFNVRY